MPYKAILFDLDGTLLDTLDDLHDAVNHALSAHSLPLRTREETRLAVGNGVGVLMTLSIPHGQDNPLFEACLATFRAYYAENSRNKTKPYDGVLPLLALLFEKGYRLGVVSNKFDSAVKALCQDYFGKLLPVAIGEREGVRRKPAPDSLFAAMNELQVSPAETIYVGDSETDVLSAQNAGIPCLSALWGFRDQDTLRKAGASNFVTSPVEIAAFLKINDQSKQRYR